MVPPVHHYVYSYGIKAFLSHLHQSSKLKGFMHPPTRHCHHENLLWQKLMLRTTTGPMLFLKDKVAEFYF